MFYSALTNGFYDISIHGQNIPEDAVEITDEVYEQIFIEQSSGKVITSDSNGYPVTIEPFFTNEELAAEARLQRDELLKGSDWTQLPDAPVNHQAWSDYRQALRDIPEQSGFPTDINWPEKPSN